MEVEKITATITLLIASFVQTGVHARSCFACEHFEPIGNGVNVADLESSIECSRASVIDRNILVTEECAPDETCVAIRGDMTIVVSLDHNVQNGTMVGMHWVSYSTVMRGCWAKEFDGCASDKIDNIIAKAMVSARVGHPVVKFYGDVCYCDSDYCCGVSCSDGTTGFFGYCFDWWLLMCFTITILIITCKIVFLACYFGCKQRKKKQNELDAWATDASGYDNPSYPNLTTKRPSIQPFIVDDGLGKSSLAN